MAIPTWVDTAYLGSGPEDITAYGRDKAGWTSMRGTSQIVQTGFVSQAGQLRQVISNNDRRFDPLYTSSPLDGYLLPEVYFDKVATWPAGGTDYPVFAGQIAEWPQEYDAFGRDQTVPLEVFDDIKVLAGASQVTLTRPSERTGERIQAILTAMGYGGSTDIATGYAVVSSIRRSQGSVSAWSHIADCVNAEWGDLYVDDDGTLVFRDRATIFTESRSLTSQATFSDTGSLKYSDIKLDALEIVNDCTVTYGTRGRSVHAADSTSKTQYGTKSLPLTTILAGKSAAKSYARWLVYRYKDRTVVPTQITVKPGANPTTYFPQVLGRKLSDMITVVRTPQVDGVASDPISVKCWIRGIQHTYSDHVWQSTTFYLQDASWLDGLFILGTSEIGSSDVLVV